MDLTRIIPGTERPLVKMHILPFFFNHILLLEVQGTSWKRGPLLMATQSENLCLLLATLSSFARVDT